MTFSYCSLPQDNRYSLCAGNSSLAIGLHLSHYFPPALTATNFCVVNKPLTLSLPFPKLLPEEVHMTGKGMKLWYIPRIISDSPVKGVEISRHCP